MYRVYHSLASAILYILWYVVFAYQKVLYNQKKCHSEASPIFTIAMFTYGRISHEAKGVSHGKEDAVVISVHTWFTREFLREVQIHIKLFISRARSKFSRLGRSGCDK